MEGIVTIKSETSEVLATGSFFTYGEEESSIHLQHKGEKITLFIKFIDEDGKDWKNHREQFFDAIDEQSARITFKNYTNNLGVFTLKPLKLGTIGRRELFFQYKIDDLQNSDAKLVFYTFHLGAEVENG